LPNIGNGSTVRRPKANSGERNHEMVITERSYAMDEIMMERAEPEILACEFSDEVLESAAATRDAAAYTMGFCTGLAACPAKPLADWW
jgi:hypothetical protein